MTWTVTQDAIEAMNVLQANGIAAGTVMAESDAYADPHMKAIGFWEELTAEEVGTHLYTSTLWTAKNTPRQTSVGASASRRGQRVRVQGACWAFRTRTMRSTRRPATSAWTTILTLPTKRRD